MDRIMSLVPMQDTTGARASAFMVDLNQVRRLPQQKHIEYTSDLCVPNSYGDE